MAGKANFSVVKGDSFIRNCTFRNKESQVAVNLTGATITGKCAGLDLTCVVTNAVQGKFSFSLSAAQTLGMRVGINKIEVQVTYQDATVQTLFSGNLVLQEQFA